MGALSAGERSAVEAAQRIADALEGAGLPYAIGGALALAIAGVPRGTADVDINVFVPEERVPDAIAVLAKLGIEIPEAATTQARERLYYVRPGEVVYLVDNDLPPELRPQEQAPVSDQVEQTRTDWMSQLVRSVTAAGLAQTVKAPAIGVPDAPSPGDTPSPTP